jgi:predicted kinase
MTRAVIFDIDGTLADLSHRLHHISGGKKDWDAFFAAMGGDAPILPVIELLKRLGRVDSIVLCSGRPDNYRETTQAWLDRQGIDALDYDALYMRAAGDTRPDHVVKAEILAGMREDGYEPWLAIDDRPSIVAMWREHGITCLQCRDWQEVPSGSTGLLTLMVGPSGAGKSYWLEIRNAVAFDLGVHPSHVVSSDQIRADLCGDLHDQTRNDEVFAALHAVVKTRIHHGLPTVVDATNLRRKDRLAVVDLAPPNARVRYIVIDRPEEEKRRDAGWRAELPIDLIAKHAQTFRSQIAEILRGDDRPNVEVIDLRSA